MIRLSGLLAGLSVLAACAPPAPPVDGPSPVAAVSVPSAACSARGGTMRPVGRMQSLQCVVRYSDAGKRCTSGEQCQGDCRVPAGTEVPDGQPTVGACQSANVRFGCFANVENGRATSILCID